MGGERSIEALGARFSFCEAEPPLFMATMTPAIRANKPSAVTPTPMMTLPLKPDFSSVDLESDELDVGLVSLTGLLAPEWSEDSGQG